MSKKIYLLCISFVFISCNPAFKLYKKNKYSTATVENSNFNVRMAKNEKIDFICYYPASYEHPKSKQELNKMWKKIGYSGPKIDDAILYSFRDDFHKKPHKSEDFYIRINPKKELSIDTLQYNIEEKRWDGNTIQLIYNKDSDTENIKLIRANMYINYTRPKVIWTLKW